MIVDLSDTHIYQSLWKECFLDGSQVVGLKRGHLTPWNGTVVPFAQAHLKL